MLAAGSALGRAGEWEGCVEYLRTSDDAERLGQALVAATMLACVQCLEYDTAIDVYKESMSNPSLGGSEWQYGGGYDIVHPIARDLALRSMGRSTKEGWSSQAMTIFRNQIVREGELISKDAVLGVVMAAERDGEWSQALDVLNIFLKRQESESNESWGVVSDSIDVLAVSTERAASTKTPKSFSCAELIYGDILASIMNTFNVSGEYGLALLCEELVGLGDATNSLLSSYLFGRQNSQLDIPNLPSGSHPMVMPNENVLVAGMTSLCGLGCHEEAILLYEEAVASGNDSTWSSSKSCVEYAKTESGSLDSIMFMRSQAWRAAFRHMHRVIAVGRLVQKKQDGLSVDESHIFANAIGKCISCCNDAGQARVGLVLADHIFAMVAAQKDQSVSLGSSVLSFFGLRHNIPHELNDHVVRSRLMVSSDLLLSATMRAYRLLNKNNEAIDLFFDTVEQASEEELNEGVFPKFVQSWNQAIGLLFHVGRAEEANNLYHALEDELKTPETYAEIGKGLSLINDWKGLQEVYSKAVLTHCVSEELALLTMKAVTEQETVGKVPTLRAIVDEAANIDGRSSMDWIKARYWNLKRILGWRYARLLMWWNNPDTASEDEFLFAIEHLEAAKLDGVVPKNDALRCIVRYASFHMRTSSEGTQMDSDVDDGVVVSRSDVIELVLEAIFEANRTTLGIQPSFIDSAASGLRALKANRECIQFVREALSRGACVNKRALVEALYASEDTGDDDAMQEMSAAIMDTTTVVGNDE